MAEVFDGKGLKVIPFYLPQFHEIPENDRWWGKGFTEWTNVKKAVPLFEGHDQPRAPLNGQYYDLTDDSAKIRQAGLAREYGIFGFCYYHYWFKDGKRLLEKPAEQMLANKDIDIPFCFCWANENWSRNWDGGSREVIMRQEYGGQKEWEKHFRYLLPFFRDQRYITVHGKPLFLIYKPDEITCLYQMISYFRKRAVEEGFPGLCMACQFPSYYYDMYYRDDLFDYRVEFEPVYGRYQKAGGVRRESRKVSLIRRYLGEDILTKYRDIRKRGKGKAPSAAAGHLSVFFYDEAWEDILSAEWTEDFLPGCFVDWDNTPRNRYGVVYSGFTPEKFGDYFEKLAGRACAAGKPMLFINAWNEWAEGAFLEPDEKYKYGKLEAIKKALDHCRRE